MADRFIEEEALGIAQLRQQEHDNKAFSQDLTSNFTVDNPIHGVFSEWDQSSTNSSGGTSRSMKKSIHTETFTGITLSSNTYDDINIPDMWSYHYIGLYCNYAAIGLLYGTSGALLSLCVYSYDGSPNLCANAQNITFFAWSFKIVFAVVTDIYRPFGMRRKPWMIFGWSVALILLLVLACVAESLDASTWLVMLLLIQFFAMFSDVPSDGYSVELGQLEPPHRRGLILATGQMIRFSFCILAGLIQAILMNGPSTNEDGCEIKFTGCWSFGLTIGQYYALLFVLVFILCIPILWLKELDGTHIPQHNLSHFQKEIWETLQNLTTFYILIFVIGANSLTNFKSVVNTYMQYYVIELTNFQAGIDTVTTYVALAGAIWVFKTYLLNKDWRRTQYVSTIFASMLGLIWLLVFYDSGGLRDGWFTIFIDLDQSFVSGITQVLFSLTVIELSKPGLEATTYELVITVGNAALTVSSIIATQLLSPLKSSACTEDDDGGSCPSNSVDISSSEAYVASDGPDRFAQYTFTILSISVACCLIFTPFLPSSKEQCKEWKERGEEAGLSKYRGMVAAALCFITIIYGFIAAILLLMPSTSCLAIVGGTGC